jgi:hypothetical protein
MNTVRCPNCRFENTFGLVYCTNCGTSLYGSEPGQKSAPTIPRVTPKDPETLAFSNTSQVAGKNSSIKYLVIAGLAAVLLLSGAVVISALLFYLGSRNYAANNAPNSNSNSIVSSTSNTKTTNTSTANKNQTATNTNTAKPNGTPEIDDTDIA